MKPLLLLLALACFPGAHAQEWKVLYDGKNLDAWEVRGEGAWKILADGTLLAYRIAGPRNPFGAAWPITEKQYVTWRQSQCWLYTKAEFGEFDLHLEYLLPAGGNSGVSIRDTSRGQYSFGPTAEFNKTPSHVGYEIQLLNGVKTKFGSGSIYLLAPATFGHEVESGWNAMEIESRDDAIRVKLNGHEVATHPGLPERPKVGPIGLQLHDRFTVAMFRNVKIRELRKGK